MTQVKLTQAERAILANQNRILAFLNEGNSATFDYRAEIFENGYEKMYAEAMGIHEAMSQEECQETLDILNMYRYINGAIKHLTPEQNAEIDLKPILFEGFDGNENTGHYLFATFLIENGRYKEHDVNNLNSHYPVIEKYREILQTYRKAPDQLHLTFNDLKSLVESVS